MDNNFELNFIIIGTKIKEKRLQHGMTQEELAEIIGVNPSHISNIECATAHPSLKRLVQISKILGCTVNDFLEWEYQDNILDNADSIDKEIINKFKMLDYDKKVILSKIIDALM